MSSLKYQIGVQSFFSFSISRAYTQVDVFSGGETMWKVQFLESPEAISKSHALPVYAKIGQEVKQCTLEELLQQSCIPLCKKMTVIFEAF
jgi:hypothetical protein